MSFCLETPKSRILKLGLSRLWKRITFCANLWLKWSLQKSYNPCWELSNDMCHITYMQVNQGDSRLLVRSQIDTLTPGPSFRHNLCFKYSNRSCEPNLDIYIWRDFPWYIKNFSIQWILTSKIALWIFENPSKLQFPKWEPIWECVGSFPHIFLHFQECKCDS